MNTLLPLTPYEDEPKKPGTQLVLLPEDASPAAKRKRQRADRQQARNLQEALSQVYQLQGQINEMLATSKAADRPNINSPADAADILTPFIAHLAQEELWILNLDRRNKVMQIVQLYKGSVTSSQVRVGELFREAIKANATAIIVAHNHPSGDPTPSPDDVAVTRAIINAGKLLDIECLDHIVIGHGRWVSLKERGLGFS